MVRNNFPVPLEKFNEHVIKLRQKNMQELKLSLFSIRRRAGRLDSAEKKQSFKTQLVFPP